MNEDDVIRILQEEMRDWEQVNKQYPSPYAEGARSGLMIAIKRLIKEFPTLRSSPQVRPFADEA